MHFRIGEAWTGLSCKTASACVFLHPSSIGVRSDSTRLDDDSLQISYSISHSISQFVMHTVTRKGAIPIFDSVLLHTAALFPWE